MKKEFFSAKVRQMGDMLGRTEKKQIVQSLVAVTGLSVTAVVGAMAAYDSFFPRYERPDYDYYPGIYNYERAEKYVKREEFYFEAGDVNLKGYYYPAENSKGIVTLSHGLHAGADDYLPIIIYLVQNNFSVFAYDGKGTYDSQGLSTVGMCQSVVDLDNALKYINSAPRFCDEPLFLLGHSCGGYAVTSVLKLNKKVKACAAIAAVNNGYTLIREKGEQYAGIIASEGIPRIFLDVYQKALFGRYSELNGTDGINSVSIPVLIAHGPEDGVVSFDGQSVISHRGEIINPNVEYYIREGIFGGHDAIWHSERAVLYKNEVSAKLAELKKLRGEKLTKDEKKAFYRELDNELYSEVNRELMDAIIKTFNKAIE